MTHENGCAHQLLLEHLTGITHMEREHLVPCLVCLCWSCHSPGGNPESLSCLRGILGTTFVGLQSATSMPFWIIEMEYLVLEGSEKSDVVNSKVPMKLRFHRTLPQTQLLRFMVQLLLFLWCRAGGSSLKITFSMCTSAFCPRSWDLCIRLLTTKLFWLKTKVFLCKKHQHFPWELWFSSTFCLHSPSRTNFCCNLQGVLPAFPDRVWLC